MKALAQQMGKERDYEILISGSQSLLPPPGASDVDVKAWQVQTQKLAAQMCLITQPHYFLKFPYLSFTNCWRAQSAT